MIRDRLALTTTRAKTTPHRLNPIDAHMRATRQRFTSRAAQAIPPRDHFAQQERQRQTITYDIHVVRAEHLPA
ncbi:MAG TPA: hypothetical protein VF883_23725 [Thermoanaerobaculia bacterium]|jgi:hypothetical protein